MTNPDARPEYESRYMVVKDDGSSEADDVLDFTNLQYEGQITNVRIFCAEDEDLRIDARPIDADQVVTHSDDTLDTGSAETVAYLTGQSEYTVGDFEDPLVEVGSHMRLELVADDNLTDVVGANIRVDERTG